MSRRLNSAQQGTQQRNLQTLQSLLKLEANKICADCKSHKHPRWASWNLGVFVCIRCSGIHRGMGTHISRVKSVDLDSWTDEQMQSMLNWGNARANKYWEAKLAAGHMPSDSKVESFIRTKYELKRWVMDGPMPDPSTLDDNENMPLSLVKEKGNIDKKETIRKASVGQSAKPGSIPAAAAAQGDLLGGQDSVPQRASTVSPPTGRVAAKGPPAPPKTTSTKDSLLGLDFFGDQPATPPRPSSTTGAASSAGSSRPDLKQSILSLYATAPRPQPQQPPAQQQFGGMASPTYPPAQQSAGGLADSFGSLSFGNTTTTNTSPPPPADPFAAFASPSAAAARPTSTTNSFGGLGGGSFFDTKPAQPPPSKHQATPSSGSFAGLGSLASPTNNIPPSKPSQPSSAALGDLFDFSSPAPAPTAAPAVNPAPSQPSNSVFNLSAPAKPQPAPGPAPVAAAPASAAMASNNWANNDVWGNAWSAPEPAAPSTTTVTAGASSNDFGGWGSSSGGGGIASTSSFASHSIVPSASGGFSAAAPPQVSADEEFGGWTSSTGGGGGGSSGAKPAGGFGASEDLFSNVWQ